MSCQVFEPGEPEPWGCYTPGLRPELACEHAAGADIARCNCDGRFGEDGLPSDVQWLSIPATSAFVTDERMFELWKTHCAK